MAHNTDPHPKPENPNTDPVPHIPEGTPKPDKGIGLEVPGEPREVPGEDYPPARKPFPDKLPDPTVEHP